MSHLFVYGTLMHPQIMKAVCGLNLAGEVAILRDYCRRPLQGVHYPAIAAATGRLLTGWLYRNLPAAAWQRLDRYEGVMYRRRPVSVHLAGGEVITAECYLLRRRYHGRFAAGEWDYATFVSHHLRDYIRTLKRDSAATLMVTEDVE